MLTWYRFHTLIFIHFEQVNTGWLAVLVIQSAAIWSRTRWLEIILEIRKKNTLLVVISNPRIYKFLEDFATIKKKACRAVVFCYRPQSTYHGPQNLLNIWTTDETFKNLENKIPSKTYWKYQLICKKLQARSSPKQIISLFKTTTETQPELDSLKRYQDQLWPF